MSQSPIDSMAPDLDDLFMTMGQLSDSDHVVLVKMAYGLILSWLAVPTVRAMLSVDARQAVIELSMNLVEGLADSRVALKLHEHRDDQLDPFEDADILTHLLRIRRSRAQDIDFMALPALWPVFKSEKEDDDDGGEDGG